ncbi:monooxygenase, FAD-binding [Granulicella sibirica]|uniref:Monooxygenase, FAD-binding n=1 Tax=Granulicella sibirica TaxID=2479048 RepID=A0A4Q0TBC5_9BACT|nr:monooxygenase, FAD-binding [Granulicella sibirica]
MNLPLEGAGEIGRSLNILFDCDLTEYVAERPGPLFYLVRTAEDDDGIGIGVLRCIKPWTRWLLIKGFAAGKEVPDLPIERAIATIRDYLGLPDLQPEVTGVDPWTMNSLYATKCQNRRVFCIGDAVHRHVPLNGLGSNTAVQDAYNLSWKLAFVLKGLAEPHLLDTYTEERMPVGKEVVEHATGALALYPALLEAIGIPAASSSNELASMWAEINAPSEAGKTRRAQIRSAVENMVYEFQTRGLELN